MISTRRMVKRTISRASDSPIWASSSAKRRRNDASRSNTCVSPAGVRRTITRRRSAGSPSLVTMSCCSRSFSRRAIRAAAVFIQIPQRHISGTLPFLHTAQRRAFSLGMGRVNQPFRQFLIIHLHFSSKNM